MELPSAVAFLKAWMPPGVDPTESGDTWRLAAVHSYTNIPVIEAPVGVYYVRLDATGTLRLQETLPAGTGTTAPVVWRDSSAGHAWTARLDLGNAAIALTPAAAVPGLPGTPLIGLTPNHLPSYLRLHDPSAQPWYLWNDQGSFAVQDSPPPGMTDVTPPGGPYTWWQLPDLDGNLWAVSIDIWGNILSSDVPPAGQGLATPRAFGDQEGTLWHFGVTRDGNLAMSNAPALDFAQAPTCLILSDGRQGRWFVRIETDDGIIMATVLEPHVIPWQPLGEIGWVQCPDAGGGLDWYISVSPEYELVALHAPPLDNPWGVQTHEAPILDRTGQWWTFVVDTDGGMGLQPQPRAEIPMLAPSIIVAECAEALRHVEPASSLLTLWAQ